MKRICHFTSVHNSEDDRIFHKECVSLAKIGYETYLVQQGESYEKDGVHIVGCGSRPESRRERMSVFSRTVFERALELDCDVYHFHDPELLSFGLKLKRMGKRVVFDSHEDVPSQIMDKHWIPAPARFAVAKAYRAFETHVVSKIDVVVAATPHIAEQFKCRAQHVVVVNNYPRAGDIVFQTRPFSERAPIACYAGGINELRGERVMVEAMKRVQGALMLAGMHHASQQAYEVPDNVIYLGQLNRAGINQLYGESVCGLVMLQPTRSYIYSLPVKMFEYMASGLPVICSDFPLWREIVGGSDAGILVPPDNAAAVSEAVSSLFTDRDMAQRMGEHGRRAVDERYNWDIEMVKLAEAYSAL